MIFNLEPPTVFLLLRTLRPFHRVASITTAFDAPEVSHKKHEPGQPFGQQATKHLAGLVLTKTVDIKKYGHDRYGRVLGVVSFCGRNINIEMIEAGLAEVYRGEPAPGQDLAPYWKAEEKARTAKRGMWAQGHKYISPRGWRKTHQGG
jgi:endonuclease YncB( thermonuclease family)